MRKCSALGCRNRACSAADGITFHKFPSNVEQRAVWAAAIGRDGWTPTPHSCICSAHFNEKDIDRTSTLRVRLREGCVPCLSPALQKARSVGKGKDCAVSEKRVSLEMPLEQLVKAATAAFEANRTSKDALVVNSASVMEKGVTLLGSGSNLHGNSRGNVTTVFCLKPITGPAAGSGCYGVIRLCSTDSMVSDYSRNSVIIRERQNVCGLRSVLKKPEVKSLGNIPASVGTENFSNGQKAHAEKVIESSSVEQKEDGPEHAKRKCIEMAVQSTGGEHESVTANSFRTDDEDVVVIEVQGSIHETAPVDEDVSEATGPPCRGNVEQVASKEPRANSRSSSPMPQPHLLDHADMCRRPQDVSPPTDASETLHHNRGDVDHSNMCHKPQNVNFNGHAKSASHSCRGNVLSDLGPNAQPVCLCSTTPSVLVLQTTEATDTQRTAMSCAENAQKSVCNHDYEIRRLQEQLDQYRALHLASRRKQKALSTCVRRHKVKKEQMKKTIEELRNKPPEYDITSGLEGVAKAGAELLKRQQLKRKGEALPTEYSPELRAFATTLRGYSLQAYQFVRKAFNGCLPHVTTVQKWKSQNEQEGRKEGFVNAPSGEAVPLVCSEDEEIIFLIRDEAVSHPVAQGDPPPTEGS